MNLLLPGSQDKILPFRYVCLTIGLSLLPAILLIAGNSFYLGGAPISYETIGSDFLARYGSHLLYLGISVFVVTVSILTIILSLVDYKARGEIIAPVFATSLAFSSVGDLLHAAGIFGYLPGITLTDVPFLWLVSRAFHATVLVVGSIVLLRFSKDQESQNKIFGLLATLFFVLLIGFVSFAITSPSVPQVSFPDSSVPRPYDIALFILYLGLMIVALPGLYKKFPSPFVHALFLSLIPALLMEAHMAFGSSIPLDTQFFVSHFLKALAYILPFIGLSYNYLNHVRRNERLLWQDELRKQRLSHFEKTSSYLRLMNNVAVSSNKARTFNEAIYDVIKVVADYIEFDAGHFLHYDQDEKHLRSSSIIYGRDLAISNAARQWVQKNDNNYDRGPAFLSLQSGRPEWTNDPELLNQYNQFSGGDIHTAFVIPVYLGSSITGFLELLAIKKLEEDPLLIQSANQIGVLLGKVLEREKLNDNLRQQQVQLKTAQVMAGMGNWSWDVNSNRMQWSDELFLIRQIKPQGFEPVLEDFFRQVHPDDKEKLRTILEEARTAARSATFYYRIITPDDETKYLFGHCEVEKDNEGRTVRIYGTSQDITARIVVEKQFESLFNAAPDSIIVMNEDGIVTGWNQKSQEIFGFAPDEAIGKRLSELIIPEKHRAAHEAGLRRFLSTGQARVLNKEIDISGVHKNGVAIPVSLKISQYKVADKNVFIGFLRDITKRKKSEELLESIMNSSLQAIMAFTSDPEEKTFVLELCNPFARALFSSEEFFILEGKKMEEVFHPEDCAKLKSKFSQTYTGGNSEFISFYSDHLEKWIDLKVVKLENGVALSAEDVTQSKEIQKKFEENKHLLQQITETVPNILTVIDVKKFKPVYSNQAFQQILGFSGEEIRQMGEGVMEKLIHPDDLEYIRDTVREMNRSSDQQSFDREFRMITRNNKERIIYSRSKVFKRDADGGIKLVLTIAEDVTDRKKSDLLLYETNRKFEAVFNQTFQLMAIISIKGIVEKINQTALDFAGLKETEVIGSRFWEINWWPHPEKYSDKLAHAVERASNGEFVTTDLIIGDEKKPFFIELSVKPILDQDGEFMFMIAEGRDVTAEKRATEKISRSERLYRTMAKNMPDSAVVLVDRNLKIQLVEGAIWNRETSSADKLIGGELKLLLQGDLYEHFGDFYKDAFKGKRSEFDIEQNEKFFKVTVIPVKNAEEEIFACLAVYHDITEIKKYQKDLELRIEELNRSNKDLEQFAYVASHDLQEPLRKIRAFGDRLATKYSEILSGDGSVYLARMENAAGRMQKMIDDLLTFSRVSRPKESFSKTDLNEIIREVLSDFEIAIEQKNAKVLITDPLPVIQAIPSQMRQLFQNLIGNALKFTREDVIPEITISAQSVTGRDLKELMVVNPNAKYFEIVVSDNGIGFDEQYKDRIFTLFQRLHSRAEYEGTGIGLSVCKKIVEFHKGIITVKSKPGEGSSFIFYLPLNQKQKNEEGLEE